MAGARISGRIAGVTVDRPSPFRFPNYRRYFAGQAVSLIGTWMQQVAQAWLVLTLTHSGTALGLIVGAQMLPVLLLGPYGGLLADRIDKRRLLLITQCLLGLLSLTTGLLVTFDAIRIWMVAALAVGIGVTNATATPARQSFVSELVDRRTLQSAVSMNSVLVNSARAIGPALAGVLIATVGIEMCFYLDALSYVFVLAALWSMDTGTLQRATRAVRSKGQIRQGFRYVRNEPLLFIPLVMMVIIGTFAYEFQVTLPLMAADTFHGDASTLGVLTAAQGLGAIGGGLFVARRGITGIRAITRGAALFGLALTSAAMAPTLPMAIATLFITGAASIQFLAVGNSTIQLTANPSYRGCVMALWTMAFLGSTPLGGPLVGWIGEYFSPRAALGVGALSCLVATGIGMLAIRRAASTPIPAPQSISA